MSFISKDFMLTNGTAEKLYHGHAAKMPIIDYHCHLSPQQIAENIQFRDITQLWLVDGKAGDHYKWRAMRANGVTEDYITGSETSSWEKFEKWADTIQHAMRNPLYHWTHLELSRAFGIDKILKPETAREIFDECNAKLATPEFRGQALIRKFNVDTLCTTDDPADDLRWHKMILDNPFGTKVLPAWRPDKAMAIENPKAYKAYLATLEEASGVEIRSYSDLMDALQLRHDFFASMGCCLSDHGMDKFYAEDYTALRSKPSSRKFSSASSRVLARLRNSAAHSSTTRPLWMPRPAGCSNTTSVRAATTTRRCSAISVRMPASTRSLTIRYQLTGTSSSTGFTLPEGLPRPYSTA